MTSSRESATSSEHVVALTTCANEEQAQALARVLVESRLAACVNVVSGVQSFYRWKGKVEQDAEFLLIVKTRRDMASKLKQILLKQHPYDVPEFLVLPIEDGSTDYLKWIDSNVG
jgi:periplasmic divalent cation tolerance protein